MSCSAVELLQQAQDAIDGTDAQTLAALTLFKASAAKAASEGDYATAIQAADGAMAVIALLPDATSGGRGAMATMSWSQSQIQQFQARMRELARQSVGEQVREVEYVNEDADEDW